MKKMLCLLALPLILLTQPTLAQDKNTAKMLVGEWRCTQSLNPDEGINLKVEYIQNFTAQRSFTLDGSMELAFDIKEMNAMFGGDALKYLIKGEGSWSTQPNRLFLKVKEIDIKPNSPIAQQMHDAGIMDADDINSMENEEEFVIANLNKNSFKLTHTKENFTTQCTRTK